MAIDGKTLRCSHDKRIAMGCQTAIAEKIVKKQGGYALAVVENQLKRHAVIQAFFAEHLKDD